MNFSELGTSQLNSTDNQITTESSRLVKIALVKYKCWIIFLLAIVTIILVVLLILDETEKSKLLEVILSYNSTQPSNSSNV